jgi:outer membrane protein assembly factor BamB
VRARLRSRATSPPTPIEAGGRRQIVFTKPDGIYAVEPETGKILWEAAYGADNGSIIMSPVRVGEYLYLGGYKEKNLLLKLQADAPGVETVWRNKPKHGDLGHQRAAVRRRWPDLWIP